jgi:putative nucleotidyltransferase with HDIG domain
MNQTISKEPGTPIPSALAERLRVHLERGTSDLPVLPRSVAEALRLARTPDLDFDELARVAAGDPPLAARVISVANSSAYARAGMPRIAAVKQAAARLGTQATRDVLYQVAYASMFVDAARYKDPIEATFQHGVRVAQVSRLLATERGLEGDVAFLAGLLHDIGRARSWKLLGSFGENAPAAALLPLVDDVHAPAGAELAQAWHLPDEVVDVCRWHHDPGARPYPRLVAAADGIAAVHEGRISQEAATERLVAAGVPEDAVEKAIALAAKVLSK